VDLRLPAFSRPGVPVLRRSGTIDAASNPPPGQTGPAGDPGTVQARSAIATWSRRPAPESDASEEQAAAWSPPTGCWPASCSTSGYAWLTLSERMGQARSMHSSMVERPIPMQATGMAARVSRSGSGSRRPRPGRRGAARRRPGRQRRGGLRRRPAVHRQRLPKGLAAVLLARSAWPWRARQCSAPWWPQPARP
jgi:hypothetical protein